ncbi:low molecular weight protein-tyrosine-phosphatase [uncultured Jatrophihabitans sp.]|uniref:low molecular weight protein-tyrosine-phosphatase n=1 Tax=uncultured Jatrophihabitans sp. TaxID=1610747 RepID=UPI0035CAB9E1
MLHAPVRISFVCSGNICRSPTAHIAFARQAEQAGLAHLVEADSAGTGSWHEGEDMDARARRTMNHAGYDVPTHVAKQFTAADFATHDIVVALDGGHRNALWWLATETDDVDGNRAKIVLLRAFDPDLSAGEQPDVADPYYGGSNGFSDVLTQVERSCVVLLSAVADALESGRPLAVPDATAPAAD